MEPECPILSSEGWNCGIMTGRLRGRGRCVTAQPPSVLCPSNARPRRPGPLRTTCAVRCRSSTPIKLPSHTRRAARMPVSAEPRTASEEADGHSKVGKHSWTPEEDEKLMAAVTKYGACRWSMIAMHVASGRVGKQCRERWNNHLCPDLKKSEWSDAEDLAILQGVADQGTRWCEICPV